VGETEKKKLCMSFGSAYRDPTCSRISGNCRPRKELVFQQGRKEEMQAERR